jgi:hypothetical protein
MCPNKSNREWAEMQANRPQDFNAACELEEKLRLKDANFFFHQSFLGGQSYR